MHANSLRDPYVIVKADNNFGVGNRSSTLAGITTGDDNTAFGDGALAAVTTGSFTWAMGTDAGGRLLAPNACVAIGFDALQGRTGSALSPARVIAIGSAAGRNVGTCTDSVFIGNDAGLGPTVGSTGITGTYLIGVGHQALYKVTSATNVVAVGRAAAHELTTGSENVFLGPYAGYNQTTLSNRLIIDNQDRGSAANEAVQSLIYGTFAATPEAQELRINGAVTLGNLEDGHYTQIEADGMLEFNGNATVWDDFVVPVQVASRSTVPGTTAPNELAYRGGVVYEFINAADRTCYFIIQLPHTYKEGTDIVFHIHWTIDTSGAAAGAENVEWDYSYSASSPTTDHSEQWPAATTGTQTVDVQTVTQHDHILTDIVTITGTGFKISEVIIMSLTRTGSTDSYNGHALLVSADVHHEIDTVGSRQIGTK